MKNFTRGLLCTFSRFCSLQFHFARQLNCMRSVVRNKRGKGLRVYCIFGIVVEMPYPGTKKYPQPRGILIPHRGSRGPPRISKNNLLFHRTIKRHFHFSGMIYCFIGQQDYFQKHPPSRGVLNVQFPTPISSPGVGISM